MKKYLVLMMLLIPVVAFCTIEWPDDPVIIALGASGMSEIPDSRFVLPDGTPYQERVGGGSYTSICEAMTMRGAQVACEAQAGAYSFDTPVGEGYLTQLRDGLASTTWQGVRKSTAVIIDQMNDCLANFVAPEPACDAAGMDAYINNRKAAVTLALQNNLKVVLGQFMPYEKLDLVRAFTPYGAQYIITAEEYAIMRAKDEAVFANRTDIEYVDAHEKLDTIDGIHGTFGSNMTSGKNYLKAAK